ncbi:MAG TPA: energy transducer TonB [Chitinophagales bacterium]|nr:energy transducer TonB [Chitinophagales bacterium]
MKAFLIALLLLGLCLGIQAQSTDTIYSYVDTMPEYPGGEGAFLKYIHKNMCYPEISRTQDIYGTVILKFVVNADGSTSDFTIQKSAYPVFDNELIRVVKRAGKFKPGLKNGKAVRVYYNFPMSILLR